MATPERIDVPARTWTDVLSTFDPVPAQFVAQNAGIDTMHVAVGPNAPTTLRGEIVRPGNRTLEIIGEANCWVYFEGQSGGKVDVLETT